MALIGITVMGCISNAPNNTSPTPSPSLQEKFDYNAINLRGANFEVYCGNDYSLVWVALTSNLDAAQDYLLVFPYGGVFSTLVDSNIYPSESSGKMNPVPIHLRVFERKSVEIILEPGVYPEIYVYDKEGVVKLVVCKASKE